MHRLHRRTPLRFGSIALAASVPWLIRREVGHHQRISDGRGAHRHPVRGAHRAQSERDGVPPEPPGALWVRRTRAPANRPSRAPVANNSPPYPGRSGHSTPAGALAASAVVAAYFDTTRALGLDSTAGEHAEPEEWGNAVLSNVDLWLTAKEVQRLAQALAAVIEPHRGRTLRGTPRWQQARPGDECHRPTPTDRSATALRMMTGPRWSVHHG